MSDAPRNEGGATQGMDPDAKRDQEPGSETQDYGRTPGDGSLKGSTPAGTSLEEMKRLGDEGGPSEGGTA